MRAPGAPRMESEIVSAILKACNLLPGVRLRRLNSRVVAMPGKGGKRRLVRFGWLGAPDLIGWKVWRPRTDAVGHIIVGLAIPVIVALEVKRPGGKATVEQQSFLDLVTADHGIAGVVTSVEEAVALLR